MQKILASVDGKRGARERIEIGRAYALGLTSQHSPHRARQRSYLILTNVTHGVVRRDCGRSVQSERKEAAIRALAPLQVNVIPHIVA